MSWRISVGRRRRPRSISAFFSSRMMVAVVMISLRVYCTVGSQLEIVRLCAVGLIFQGQAWLREIYDP
jgi:hypothetical protein